MERTATDTDDTVTLDRMALRNGGWVGYSEDGIFVDRDGQRIKIHSGDISTIALQVVAWDVAVMSVLLIGLGGYVAATRSPLVGLAFGAVGLFSLYRTYVKRYRLVIEVENEPKPVTMHPAYPKECHETLAERLGLEIVK